MKTTRINRIGRCWLAAVTLLAGGTVMGTCEVRLHDAFMTSTKSLALGVFDSVLGSVGENLTTGEEAESTTE